MTRTGAYAAGRLLRRRRPSAREGREKSLRRPKLFHEAVAEIFRGPPGAGHNGRCGQQGAAPPGPGGARTRLPMDRLLKLPILLEQRPKPSLITAPGGAFSRRLWKMPVNDDALVTEDAPQGATVVRRLPGRQDCWRCSPRNLIRTEPSPPLPPGRGPRPVRRHCRTPV